jgi:hypothetical protein
MKTFAEISALRRVKIVDSGPDGFAAIVRTDTGTKLLVICGWGGGWDHVSVSTKTRTPRYQEMKLIKRLLFKPDEWCVEYHPPATSYISNNDNVLHIWRPQTEALPTPPSVFV